MRVTLSWFPNVKHATLFDNAAGNGGGNDGGNGAAGSGAGGDGSSSDRTYTKAELEAAIVAERTRAEQTHRKTVSELSSLKSQSQLSQEEKTALQKRIDDLEKEYMTKEELATRAAKQRETEQQEHLTKLQSENEVWRKRFEHNLKRSAIVDAAAKQGALNPDMIYTLLSNESVIEQVNGSDGKPTDNFRVKVKHSQKTAEGQVKELVLDPIDAMKLIAEDKGYAFMFAGNKAGGVGGQQSTEGEVLDFAKMTPEQYRKHRSKIIS